ncbi:MAG: ABC transporter ATP-binding protein [Angelakisella sp.]
MSIPIIKFQDFSFQYNAQAEPTLCHINLTINEGERVLIAGASGSGKSTLGNCINGLIPFSYKGTMTGSLTVSGMETREQSLFELSKRVGTVLQDPDGQFVGLTVGEDIAFALENERISPKDMRDRVYVSAAMVEVEEYLEDAPHELSGGQKQRVSLAGVLVDNVRILLFDEPLANLDPATGKTAMVLIDSIQKQSGATVIVIEHRLEEALLCGMDRVILMEDGRIVADMPPDQLMCTDLLQRCGLREPLYLTALRYADCRITKVMQAGSISTLQLHAAQQQAVRDWFRRCSAAPAPELGENLIELRDVEFWYENGARKVLHNVNMTVRRGELVAIVGKNGAGKSTLSKLICGFERPKRGKITLAEWDLADDSVKEIAHHIGYVMQNPNQMISKHKIFDEVALGLTIAGVTGEELTQRVDKMLTICGLAEFRDWPISALSFGQKKRVTIASILVMGPQVLILDEPTAGQDFRHYTDIMEFLLRLNETGITIILITHDMHLMLEYAQRAIVFTDGFKIADEPPAWVLTDDKTIKAGSLRETSLFRLARLCRISDAQGFVQRFIEYDRSERAYANKKKRGESAQQEQEEEAQQ